jgi:uncharacterized protein YcbK (DUF882 family)
MSRIWTRRSLLKTTLAGGIGLSLANLAVARAVATQGEAVQETPFPARTIELHNTHTNETVSVVYKRGKDFDATAIAQLRNVMRDHRNNQAHDIDPALYDQLYDLALTAKCDPRYEIISGYRSPESNAEMAARPGSGVAKHSLHMQGQAIDVRLHSCNCANLRDLALAAARGGVGYYRSLDFVHLDTGRVRTWNG